MENLERIRSNIEVALDRIRLAEHHYERDLGSVSLQIAVKTQTPQDCRAAAQALADLERPILLGHNRVQEAQETTEAIHQVPGARLHLIGPLQSNKINHALRSVDAIDTLDRLSLVTALDSRATAPLPVMIQVNVSGESTKSGLIPSEVPSMVEAVMTSQNLRLAGFMTVGLHSSDEAAVRNAYADLRKLRDQSAAAIGLSSDQLALSMGMSGDLEWAIAEGSTIVRLGTAIFGPRVAK